MNEMFHTAVFNTMNLRSSQESFKRFEDAETLITLNGP